MSRKFISIIFIIIIAGIGYWVYQSRSGDGNRAGEETALDPKNCTYVIEERNIVLEEGYAEEEIVAGSAIKLITRYFGNKVSGDFDGNGFSDIAFLLTQDPGGSGTFYYVTVALGSDDGCKGTNAILLGDRIAPQTTEFRNGEIIVNYADRKAGEPMTVRPSMGISKYLKVSNGSLIEVQK